jgi:uroporphyrinogen-III synthase
LGAVENRPEKSVAVQEYGRKSQELLDGLAAQGRAVRSVPVYQWKFPEDTQPLAESVEGILAGKFQAVLFTTGVQLDHLLQFAEQQGHRDAVNQALRKLFIASIGPTCTEVLRESGIRPAVEPSHPKMGILVREAALAFGK